MERPYFSVVAKSHLAADAQHPNGRCDAIPWWQTPSLSLSLSHLFRILKEPAATACWNCEQILWRDREWWWLLFAKLTWKCDKRGTRWVGGWVSEQVGQSWVSICCDYAESGVCWGKGKISRKKVDKYFGPVHESSPERSRRSVTRTGRR